MGNPLPYRNKVKTLPKWAGRVFYDLFKFKEKKFKTINSNLSVLLPPVPPGEPTVSCDCCANVVTVSKDDKGDFGTIQEAIDFAVAQSPGPTSPWVVQICPGQYDEALTGGDYVSLMGVGSQFGGVRVTATNEPVLIVGAGIQHYDNIVFQSNIDGTVPGVPAVVISQGLLNVFQNCSVRLIVDDSWGKLVEFTPGSSSSGGQFFNCDFLYTMDGSAGGSSTHYGIDASDLGVLFLYSCRVSMSVNNPVPLLAEDVVFIDLGGASHVEVYHSRIDVSTALPHTGIVYAFKNVLANSYLESHNNWILLTADTTANCYYSSGSGAMTYESSHNWFGMNAATKYWANINNASCIMRSNFDYIRTDALFLNTSSAEFEFLNSVNDGDFSVSSEIRFYEGVNYVGFKAPALGADQIWELPDSDGSSGDALVTDGAGALSWGSAGGGGFILSSQLAVPIVITGAVAIIGNRYLVAVNGTIVGLAINVNLWIPDSIPNIDTIKIELYVNGAASGQFFTTTAGVAGAYTGVISQAVVAGDIVDVRVNSSVPTGGLDIVQVNMSSCGA